MKPTFKNQIAKAIALCGSQRALGEKLGGVSQQAVHRWVKQGWCPLARATQIAKMFKCDKRALLHPSLRNL